ncbi:MAG: putative toxin-antitoxin system toxin component, PIN family [Candidatus Dormibacteria bacterium]
MTQWVVLDTNVLVSDLLRPGSIPNQLVLGAVAGRFLLLTSPALLAELDRVLRYPKLAAAFPAPSSVVARIQRIASVVAPGERLSVASDDADNRVLEAAVAGKADAIVTGDRSLLAVGSSYAGIPLLTPRQFADVLEHQPSP